jgi:hypothetical protein
LRGLHAETVLPSASSPSPDPSPSARGERRTRTREAATFVARRPLQRHLLAASARRSQVSPLQALQP